MEQVVQRIYGNSSLYIGRVALKTLYLYLATIYFTHVNRILPVIVFKNALLCYILNRATSLNFNLKEATLKLLILYSILVKITISSNLILGVNTDAAFYLTFAGCLHIGEISYTNKQRSKPSFAVTKAIYLDIQFSPFRNHLTFCLKQSKTNKDKQGVQIIVTATFNAVCPVTALQRLFFLNPQAPSTPLFTIFSGVAFSALYTRKMLKLRLNFYSIPATQYTGYSFRKGAA